MRKIREVLRLKLERGLSNQLVATSVQLSRSTIADYVRRAQLFSGRYQPPKPDGDLPDWEQLDKELRR